MLKWGRVSGLGLTQSITAWSSLEHSLLPLQPQGKARTSKAKRTAPLRTVFSVGHTTG